MPHACRTESHLLASPKYAPFLGERMPNASVQIIDGGTHFGFAEYRDEVNQAIAGFVDSLDATR